MILDACRIPNEQFATNDTYDYSYGQGADSFGLLRRPTGRGDIASAPVPSQAA